MPPAFVYGVFTFYSHYRREGEGKYIVMVCATLPCALLGAQWVADCWHKDFHGAPTDGSTWTAPDCRDHVLRGGSWKDDPSDVRVSSRAYYDTGVRYVTHGFRVARSP